MTTVSQTAREPRHTVTALFDTRQDAVKAKADLLAAGFSEDCIAFVEGPEAMALAKPPRQENVLTTLMNIFIFMPKDDRSSVEEALRRGAIALSVRALRDDYERAIDILDRDGAIDLDERQIAWQQQDGMVPPTAPMGERSGFKVGKADDTASGAAANPDVRERIGVGTADMMVGMDPAPPHAEPDAAIGAARPIPQAPASETPDAAINPDMDHGRSRGRTDVRSGAAIPRGIDPQI